MNLAPAEPHLLDSSAVIHLVRSGRVAAPGAFVGFATLAELEVGIVRAADSRREQERVIAALGASPTLFPTKKTVRRYGETMAYLQRTGQTIPHNDVWNAALALEHGVALLGDDEHFRRVPGLRYLPVR